MNCRPVTNGILCALSLLTFSAINACRTKDKPVAPTPPPTVSTYGKVNFRISNEVDGQPVKFDTVAYTNASGNRYSISTLKYYVTNFTLIKDDSTEKNFGNYKLVDATDTNTCHFTLDSVANGNYKAIRFYLGVDTGHNHTGVQLGDLDPINGMIWTWKTGYIFFKHEGNFIDTNGKSSILVYHYGTDGALATVDIPVTTFQVLGNTRTVEIKFNLNALYANPVKIAFNNGNNVRQSTDFNDAPWINAMRTNFPSAFTVDKVE